MGVYGIKCAVQDALSIAASCMEVEQDALCSL